MNLISLCKKKNTLFNYKYTFYFNINKNSHIFYLHFFESMFSDETIYFFQNYDNRYYC